MTTKQAGKQLAKLVEAVAKFIEEAEDSGVMPDLDQLYKINEETRPAVKVLTQRFP